MMTNPHGFATRMPSLDARILNVLRYWDELRGDRVAPGRVEIRPGAITRHLSRICILERPRAGTVRMRLAGATLSGHMGMELRGMPFRVLFDLDDRNMAMDAAETAITTPAVNFLSLSRTERGTTVPGAMMALLPLTDTRGALTRALAIYSESASTGAFVTDPLGRFQVTDSWSLDVPERGPIIDALAAATPGKPISTHVHRTRGNARVAPQLVASQLLVAQDLPFHAKPVFQVIDGGVA